MNDLITFFSDAGNVLNPLLNVVIMFASAAVLYALWDKVFERFAK